MIIGQFAINHNRRLLTQSLFTKCDEKIRITILMYTQITIVYPCFLYVKTFGRIWLDQVSECVCFRFRNRKTNNDFIIISIHKIEVVINFKCLEFNCLSLKYRYELINFQCSLIIHPSLYIVWKLQNIVMAYIFTLSRI